MFALGNVWELVLKNKQSYRKHFYGEGDDKVLKTFSHWKLRKAPKVTRTPVNYQNIFLEIDGGDCFYKIFEFFYKNNRLSESDRSTQLMRYIVKQLTDESTLSHTSSRGHRQRFSSSQTCDTPQPGFGTAQVIYSDFV